MPVENPSTGAILGHVPLSTAAETNRAIEAAAAAYPAWSRTAASRRVGPLFALLELLRRNEEDLARSITEENGKSLTDARAEMKRAIENCEVACGMPVLQQGDKLIGAADGIDGEVLRLPLGVFGMIAPFNFPGMVPFWFFPYALAAGNTYVLKPSEQTPLTLQRITRLLDQAGFPPGVFNLVHGDRAVADALMEHPQVQGVSLVGSTRTCHAVAEKCVRHKKRFQAMGGAKNHLVVMPDARIEEVIRNLLSSCFGCAGQRCMAASAIVAVGQPTYDEVCRRLIEGCGQLLVANPARPGGGGKPDGHGTRHLGQVQTVHPRHDRDRDQRRRPTGARRSRRAAPRVRRRTLRRAHRVHRGPTRHEDSPDRDLWPRRGRPAGRAISTKPSGS